MGIKEYAGEAAGCIKLCVLIRKFCISGFLNYAYINCMKQDLESINKQRICSVVSQIRQSEAILIKLQLERLSTYPK
jgi:hypothetical protein